MKIDTDPKKIQEVLERGVDSIFPSHEALSKALLSGKRLRIYIGVDATGQHLHLGHLTNFLALRRLQKLGHEIIFLVGDFTAQIGDPTDKLAARQPLTELQVRVNYKTFKEQISKILDFTGTNAAKFRFNSRWLAKMSLVDVMRLAQKFTYQQIIQRDMFRERIKNDKPIGVHEFLYPLLQGYDSVAMDVDVEMGGTDQTFNMLVGRDLMRLYKKKEKFVITTVLLVHPKTGKKLMNKSEGGMINMSDAPADIFGKVMALDDVSMFPVAELSSEMPLSRVEELKRLVAANQMNPRDAKLEIAYAVVQVLHGDAAARSAKQQFIKTFTKKETPTDLRKASVEKPGSRVIDLLYGLDLCKSLSDARRLIEGGGVRIAGEKVEKGKTYIVDKMTLIEVGKLVDNKIMWAGKRHEFTA